MDSNDNRNSANIRYTLFVFLIGVAVALIAMTVFFKVINKSEIVSQKTIEYYKDLDKEYGKYYELSQVIEDNSIYDVDENKRDEMMMAGITESIDDKYIKLFTEEEYDAFQRAYAGTYTGIGVSITETENKEVLVKRVLEGGPAEKAGIKAGDIITRIDGKTPEDIEEASDMMRGEAGTEVEVDLLRNEEEINMTIVRGDVEDASVASVILNDDKGIGYIRIVSFTQKTSDELETAAKGLVKDGCDKIIIDIRKNGGGVMQEGVKCADILLPACKIMTAKDAGGKETVYNSDESCIEAKYAILVDDGTASASEIFAGAIKDNKGGVIVGSKTYGKGVIQGIFKLRDKSRLKLTIQEYFLPNGEAINDVGVKPDVEATEENAIEVAVKTLLEE